MDPGKERRGVKRDAGAAVTCLLPSPMLPEQRRALLRAILPSANDTRSLCSTLQGGALNGTSVDSDVTFRMTPGKERRGEKILPRLH
jgi:hypothetical protein